MGHLLLPQRRWIGRPQNQARMCMKTLLLLPGNHSNVAMDINNVCTLSRSAESFRIERSMMGSKVCRRQVCMGLAQREAPKTNGHPVSVPPSSAPKAACPPPRLGRPLNLRPHGITRHVRHFRNARSCLRGHLRASARVFSVPARPFHSVELGEELSPSV